MNVVSSFAQHVAEESQQRLGDESTHSGIHRTPELYLRPIQSPLKLLPMATPAGVSSFRSAESAAVPKQRARVPPLAYFQTLMTMKESLEFNPLCLQQELRAGAYPIYVCASETHKRVGCEVQSGRRLLCDRRRRPRCACVGAGRLLPAMYSSPCVIR